MLKMALRSCAPRQNRTLQDFGCYVSTSTNLQVAGPGISKAEIAMHGKA